MSDLRSIFGDVLPRFTFVDVGAMQLGTEPYAPLVSQGIGTVVGFEPVPEECAKLNQQHSGTGHRFLPYAIGDGTPGHFNICNYPMTSSLYKPNMPLISKLSGLEEVMQVIRVEEVVTRRLDDITEVAEADYIKMDVQGAELQILRGASQVLDQVLIVHTEVEFVPLYENQPLFGDIDAELRSRGFLFHRFLSLKGTTFRPFPIGKSFSQQLWTDAVYVKDFTRFEELPPRKLLKLAIMLHELYQSYDLCTLALKVFDEATGFRLHERYIVQLSNHDS